MEMTVCLLLLLLCSPSTAQLQSHTDNHIIAPGEQTEGETADASNQEQIWPQDIHAVLRELSASVAEQRAEMRHLQRENEAQEAKLESQRAEVERQKQKNEAQEAKLRELESQRAEMEKLKQHLEAQAAELVKMKSRTNLTENQVEALRRDGEVKQVAFSASLTVSDTITLGPYNTYTNLVFKHVVSNIGNAYSPDTGLFIAPVRGAYHFEFYIAANGQAIHVSGAVLVKNGEQVFIALKHQENGYGTSANGVTLLLEVGDVVFMRQWINSKIYDNLNHHTTFSGHLLFTM